MHMTPQNGSKEISWETVAEAPGFAAATIVAGRLQAEGIPTHVWQEGAGRAIGLTIGILGTGFVAVPKEYAEQARHVLSETAETWVDEEDTTTPASDENPR